MEIAMYPDGDFLATYQNDDQIFFFSSPFDPFNNWSAHIVEMWGVRFPTLEHAYHYSKFSRSAPDIAQQILNSSNPYLACTIAHEHSDIQRADWFEVNLGIMYDLLKAKFSQNQDAKECLLATGDKQINENSPVDTFWGTGPNGSGQNHMGKLLMRVRSELQPSE